MKLLVVLNFICLSIVLHGQEVGSSEGKAIIFPYQGVSGHAEGPGYYFSWNTVRRVTTIRFITENLVSPVLPDLSKPKYLIEVYDTLGIDLHVTITEQYPLGEIHSSKAWMRDTATVVITTKPNTELIQITLISQDLKGEWWGYDMYVIPLKQKFEVKTYPNDEPLSFARSFLRKH